MSNRTIAFVPPTKERLLALHNENQAAFAGLHSLLRAASLMRDTDTKNGNSTYDCDIQNILNHAEDFAASSCCRIREDIEAMEVVDHE